MEPIHFSEPAPAQDAAPAGSAQAITATLESTAEPITNPTAQTDTLTVRMVVAFLGAIVILGMGSMAYLIWGAAPALINGDANQAGGYIAVLALISQPTATALGALGAVLVSTRSRG